MLQILGDSLLIATRMDRVGADHRHRSARPPAKEPEAAAARRRGWLHFSGILL